MMHAHIFYVINAVRKRLGILVKYIHEIVAYKPNWKLQGLIKYFNYLSYFNFFNLEKYLPNIFTVS